MIKESINIEIKREMSQVKSKRIAPSAVNTPVTVHVRASKALSKEDTERFLSKFIENEETRANQNLLNNSGNVNVTGASVSQLKRIQRDLRGLPPLESTTTTSTTGTTSSSTIKSKSAPKTHMKFDDEPQEVKESTETNSIPQDDSVDSKSEVKIDKEERKRLKKEKKKAEKKAKLEKSE